MKLRVSYDEAHIIYNTKIKRMGDHLEVKHYKSLMTKRKDGYEPSNQVLDKLPNKPKERNADNGIRRDNLSRSFNSLMEYAFCNSNDFKSFITLTFKENVTDLDLANKHYNIWTKQLKREFPELMLLGVPEFQKRGAVHYHVMTNIPLNSNLIVPQGNALGCYDVKYWNHGFTSVFDLKLTDDKFSVSLYLAKYFWKDIDNRLFGRKKILKTQNLKKAITREMVLESEEFEKYTNYLQEKFNLDKTKDINGDKPFMPSYTIYNYSIHE